MASEYAGIVLHHSACPEIKKEGYDFYICKDGTVVTASNFLDDDYIHVCIEGDFSEPITDPGLVHEQMFVLVKLMLRLASAFDFDPEKLIAHGDTCPGLEFPWHELKLRIDRPPH